ncbi:MAG TPA: GNAT family N-acetyltransferase [Acidimicrobiales bacterium]|nr:GNAT family N-acetyltransferase [Acidimicrobiales bacterium]
MEAARVAVRADLPRLTELARTAVEEAASRRGGAELVGSWAVAGENLVEQAMASCLTDPARGVWVGTVDSQVMGVSVAGGREGQSGKLHLFFVEPGARGVGVGEAMLNEVSGWLRERGCTGMDVPVLPGDRDTKQFFEGAAMVARLLIMHRSL